MCYYGCFFTKNPSQALLGKKWTILYYPVGDCGGSCHWNARLGNRGTSGCSLMLPKSLIRLQWFILPNNTATPWRVLKEWRWLTQARERLSSVRANASESSCCSGTLGAESWDTWSADTWMFCGEQVLTYCTSLWVWRILSHPRLYSNVGYSPRKKLV